MKVYTKKGDKGMTSLIGGTRVPKHHLRIESYGTVDELNSYIGVIRDHKIGEHPTAVLIEIQDRLFTIGSLLAADPENSKMKLPELSNSDIEFLENEILKLIETSNQSQKTVRVKLVVFRDSDGLYTPITNDVSYLITTKELNADFYQLDDVSYRVDLYKDHYLSPSLLSTLKSNNRLINIIGGIYAKENILDNCLLLNTNKNVVEALNSNIFLVKEKLIKTPPLTDGCIKGVMRKQIMEIIKLMPEYIIEEKPISPFELQKADELFLTNVITGIQPITNYRKKQFSTSFSKNVLAKLNVKVRLA